MKILYVTTVSVTMNRFFKPHIEMLVAQGHHVDIACNYKALALGSAYEELGCTSYQIDFSRSPLSADNIKAYGQLKKVIGNGKYDIVHCHTPNASVITRLVCRQFRKKNGLKLFYTAHGFHFYQGAPKLNWIVFYPVEKFCSRFTDKLITINQEDYALAKSRFRAKEVCCIPGVGVDLSETGSVQADIKKKRRDLGIPEDAFVLLSVGELNKNKNHQVIIRALERVNHPAVHYAIAGVGDKREELLQLANELGVSERVHLLGYRNDMQELYEMSDCFAMPSYREGLSRALMEAMASGLPCIASRIRGNTDLLDGAEGGFLCKVTDVADYAEKIELLAGDTVMRETMGRNNLRVVQKFSTKTVIDELCKIYEAALKE